MTETLYGFQTEWLENIFLNGAVEAKEINYLND